MPRSRGSLVSGVVVVSAVTVVVIVAAATLEGFAAIPGTADPPRGTALRPAAPLADGDGDADAERRYLADFQGGASRREAAVAGLSAALGVGALGAAQPARAAEPKITARCEFDVKFGAGQQGKSKLSRKVVIGLYGEEAPGLTQNFLWACTGTYPGYAGLAFNQAKYSLSDVKYIDKDKAITWADFKDGNFFRQTGQVNDAQWVKSKVTKLPLGDEDTKADDTNDLRHDVAGRVSMARGGGTFDFTVAPVGNAVWLDRTNVVIGQVLEGMDVIADINNVPVKDLKPLKKVRIQRAKLLEEQPAPALADVASVAQPAAA